MNNAVKCKHIPKLNNKIKPKTLKYHYVNNVVIWQKKMAKTLDKFIEINETKVFSNPDQSNFYNINISS